MRSASDVADADDLSEACARSFHLHCSCLLLYEHGPRAKPSIFCGAFSPDASLSTSEVTETTGLLLSSAMELLM